MWMTLPLSPNHLKKYKPMLKIMQIYAEKWRYSLNGSKSLMVFGESTCSRTQARSSQKWYLGSEVVEEADEVQEILRSVSFSIISCTNERSSALRSAFFHPTPWGVDSDAYTLSHPIDSTPPNVFYYAVWL